ncbi:hypothetical protein B0H11DRAFT_2237753 [Mycena galericulata]|nr:hypothetical protein B0H11DRAFT_2244243 [Mycena galericulata]KAJ7470166.1 hypothetical protein B0H11DRAFT_2237753 [Mycena galericulata]
MPPSDKKILSRDLNPLQREAFEKRFPLSARQTRRAKGGTQTSPEDITAHQWEVIKKHERNEKARIRMAKCVKRAALKSDSAEAQAAYATKERAYGAKFRAGHRLRLAKKAEKRRNRKFLEEFGSKAFARKRLVKYAKRVEREIKQGLRDPACIEDAVEDMMDMDSDCAERDIDPVTGKSLL